MSSPKIDEVIQEALDSSANEIEFSTDLFPAIKTGISVPRGWKASIPRFYFDGLSLGKKILLTTSGIILLLLTCTLFSKDFRVMAEDVFNAVKTIFVVEGTVDNYQIVEKPVEAVPLTHSVSSTTQLNDSELSQKVGYQVSFPDSLYGDFILDNKALGVILEKPMDYNQGREMQSSMLKAVTDDQELEKLKIYGARRKIFGTYRNYQGVTVFINIDPVSNSIPLQGKNPVSIGKAHGFWNEYPFSDYPYKEENGVGTSDMTQKPMIRLHHSLIWEWNGLRYHLCFYKENELSLAESVKVAESFMEGQK